MSPPPPQPEPTDEALLAAGRKGDDTAFGTLINRYQQELFHFLLRFTRNRAAADDLFQETFLQVYLAADRFDVDKRFKPWLFTIAANKARDYLRRNRKRQTAALSAEATPGHEGGRTFMELLAADLPEPPQVAEDADTAQRVRDVVDTLPEHLREILLLAYFQQLPYRDIADVLGVPLGTVKSRLHAAVGSFADLWRRKYEDSPNPDPAE